MDLRTARSIDEIFQEAAEYNLVLTSEPALADALNARIETARFGLFAATPFQLIQSRHQNTDLLQEQGMFLELIEDGFDWRDAAHAIERITECWEHTGSLRAVRDHLDRDPYKAAIDLLEDRTTLYATIEDHSIDEELDVAVIDPGSFSPLDRSILPEDYDTISPFKEGRTTMEDIRLLPSTEAIIQTVKEAIRQNDPEEIAVVVEPGSQYDRSLRAALDVSDIPYMHRKTLQDSQHIRELLTLIATSFETDIRLKDIQPLLTRHDIDISIREREKRLGSIEAPEARQINRMLTQIQQGTVRDAIDLYNDTFDGSSIQDNVKDALADTGILDEPVSDRTVGRLQFYLDTYDIELNREQQGLLLATPDTAHIDRSLIIHLGMDAGWTEDIPDRPWIDRERLQETHTRRFEQLLQTGSNRLYLAQRQQHGQEITPCFYFNDIDSSIENFTDLPSRQNNAQEEEENDGFRRHMLDVNTSTISTVSQSTLNKLVHCPRDYMFSRLVDQHRQPYFVKGTLFHDFAEFYVNRPDIVREKGLQAFIDIMLDDLDPFIQDIERPQERTELRLGLETISSFLDDHEITGQTVDGYINPHWISNRFAEAFDTDMEHGATEMWFNDSDLGGKGLIDLILAPDHLLDYKSSSQESARSIVTSSNVDLLEDDPSFQALLYLAHHRRQVPDQRLRFTFFHFLENVEDVIEGGQDVEDAFTTITYYPEHFSDAIADEDLFQKIIGDVAESNDRRKTLEKLGHDRWQQFLEDRNIEDPYDKDDVLDTGLADDLLAYARQEVGDYTYVEDGIESALRRLVDIRTQNFFVDDMERFKDMLQDWIDNLNRWRASRFPVLENDLEEIEHRDLVLTGDGR